MKNKIFLYVLGCSLLLAGCTANNKQVNTNTTSNPATIVENVDENAQEKQNKEEDDLVVDVTTVEDADNVETDIAIDNENEVYKLTFKNDAKNVRVYQVEYLSEQDELQTIALLYSTDEVIKGDSVTIRGVIPEVMSSIKITYDLEKTKDCSYFLCYNGKDGGGVLIPAKGIANSSITNFETYSYGEEIEVDLNDDGIKEKVLYVYKEGELVDEDNGYGGYYTNPTIMLSINGEVLYDSSEENSYLEYPLEKFAIGDLDTTDNYKDIMLLSYWDNDYQTTSLLHYDGKNLKNYATISGLIGDTAFANNGFVYNTERIDALATSSVNKTYKVSGEIVEEVKPTDGLYFYNTYNGNPFTSKRDVIVYKKMDENSETFTIPKGSILISNKTNCDKWSNIIYDGNEYWYFFDIENYDNWEKVTDDFEGLFFAG